MTDTVRAATPWHLWLIGALALLWNSGGAYDYLMTQTQNAAYLENFTQEQLDYVASFPVWAEATWAIAVWGSVAGSLLLLLRLNWAFPVFAAALACLLINFTYQLFTGGFETMGTGGMVFSAIIVVSICFLTWYAYRMKAAGVLR